MTGVLHLLYSPGDVLGLFAAALLAGSRGETASRLAAIVIPTVWLVSGLVGLSLLTADLPSLGLVLPTILGVLVAADMKLRPMVVAVLVGLFAAFHGLLNGSALAASGAGLSSLLGTVVAVLIVFLLLSAAVVRLRSVRERGVVRLIGCSVIAAGLFELSWPSDGLH